MSFEDQPKPKPGFGTSTQWLKAATGRFRRYPAVLSALRDFNHAAASFYQVDRRTGTTKEYDEWATSLDTAFNALLRASDAATNRPRTKGGLTGAAADERRAPI